jgi:hypothetical protein
MDSLPTGSTQSWLIVATAAFSPVIILLLADCIGWVLRQAKGKGDRNGCGKGGSGIAQ